MACLLGEVLGEISTHPGKARPTAFAHHPRLLKARGATRAFLEGATASSLKYRGRWRQESSLEVYIQEAMAHLLFRDLSQQEYDTIHSLLCLARPQWLSPPPLLWAHYFSRGAQWRKNLRRVSNIFKQL